MGTLRYRLQKMDNLEWFPVLKGGITQNRDSGSQHLRVLGARLDGLMSLQGLPIGTVMNLVVTVSPPDGLPQEEALNPSRKPGDGKS